MREALRYVLAPIIVAGAVAVGKPALAEPLNPPKPQECHFEEPPVELTKKVGREVTVYRLTVNHDLFGMGSDNRAKMNYQITENIEVDRKIVRSKKITVIINNGKGFMQIAQEEQGSPTKVTSLKFTPEKKNVEPMGSGIEAKLDCINWQPDESKFEIPN